MDVNVAITLMGLVNDMTFAFLGVAFTALGFIAYKWISTYMVFAPKEVKQKRTRTKKVKYDVFTIKGDDEDEE